MKFISKSKSPDFFEDWKREGNTCWDDIEKKDNYIIKCDLRRYLLQEQGYLCCYCGDEVDEGDKSVIEHLKCREYNESLHLEYTNLLISCKGGQKEREGKNKKDRKKIPIYCDTNKDNDDISISPLDPECENKFVYGVGGELSAFENDSDTEETIKTLNIGTKNKILKNKRAEAISKLLEPFPTKEEVQIIINKYDSLFEQTDSHGYTVQKYKPFSNAVIGALKVFL